MHNSVYMMGMVSGQPGSIQQVKSRTGLLHILFAAHTHPIPTELSVKNPIDEAIKNTYTPRPQD
jgi:hypothetical protein